MALRDKFSVQVVGIAGQLDTLIMGQYECTTRNIRRSILMTDPKIEPCPMPGCGGECWDVIAVPVRGTGRQYQVKCLECVYAASQCDTKPEAIAAHNQLCERNRLGKAAEKFMENPPWDKHIDQQSRVFNEGVQACRDMLKVDNTNS